MALNKASNNQKSLVCRTASVCRIKAVGNYSGCIQTHTHPESLPTLSRAYCFLLIVNLWSLFSLCGLPFQSQCQFTPVFVFFLVQQILIAFLLSFQF